MSKIKEIGVLQGGVFTTTPIGANVENIDIGNINTETSATNLGELVDEMNTKFVEIEDSTGGEETPDLAIDASTLGGVAASEYATKTFVENEVADLVGSAPETLDTIHELAAALQDNTEVVEALDAAIVLKADKSALEDVIDGTTPVAKASEASNANALDGLDSTAFAKLNQEANFSTVKENGTKLEEKYWWKNIPAVYDGDANTVGNGTVLTAGTWSNIHNPGSWHVLSTYRYADANGYQVSYWLDGKCLMYRVLRDSVWTEWKRFDDASTLGGYTASDFAKSIIPTISTGMEIVGLTPYIDFHHNNADGDYTSRIIADNPAEMTIDSMLKVTGQIREQGINLKDKYLGINNASRGSYKLVVNDGADTNDYLATGRHNNLSFSLVNSSHAGSLPVMDNANGVLTVGRGGTNYHAQLGFTYTGMYYRNFNNTAMTADAAWKTVLFDEDAMQHYAVNENYSGRELSEFTWAQLSTKSSSGDFSGLRVGDYKTITCTDGEVFKMQIAGLDTYYKTTDQNTGHHIDWISVDCHNQYVQWNTTNNNNGTAEQLYPYLASNVYNYVTTTLYNKLPDEVKNVIKNKRFLLEQRYSASGLLNDSNSWGWVDLGKVWIPSEYEVFGSTVWGSKSLGAMQTVQYPLFANSWKHRIKGLGNGGSRCDWWSLSTTSGSSPYCCSVNYAGYAYYAYASNTWFSVPLCFRT